MSRNYKIRDQGGAYFVTITIVGWIQLFTRTQYSDIYLESCLLYPYRCLKETCDMPFQDTSSPLF